MAVLCDDCNKKTDGRITVSASFKGGKGVHYQAKNKGICENCLNKRSENYTLEREIIKEMEEGFGLTPKAESDE
ncbi:MAG: hypothetical protein ABJG33_00195 [Balneola sp.]